MSAARDEATGSADSADSGVEVDVERTPGEHGVGGPAGEAHTAELRERTAEAVHRHVVVAVDGPAGSGKSSVSRASAVALGYDYQDTGAAYRAFALHALDSGVDLDDADAVIGALPSFAYAIEIDPARASSVTVGGADVTDEIRTPRVTGAVSHVAKLPEVRRFMVDLFRRIIASTDRPGIVTEGRDITTVVAPDAQVRILLTATEEARMARRSAEVTGQSAEETARQLSTRDRLDSKVVDFMTAAEGVSTVDSTHLDFDQTVQAVVELVRASTPTR
ncbi:cytidylate kinase [Frigoribacterium sp. PhB107]|uniref:(d)CMP kinase n=1 Tax=Frigoribacterium sp. PhB107 TaxID=2485172 RepID=UPI000FB032FB|nr:cytidylate kinase [Frigoribacterium sp. PhB107]